MLKPRTKGLEALQALLVVLWLPLLFFILIGINLRIRPGMLIEDVNFLLYGLVIGVSSLALFGLRSHAGVEIVDIKWVNALRQSSYGILFVSFWVFGLVFATKDQAISRLLLGSFLVTGWISLVLIHRFLPWILSRVLFGRREMMRTVLVGSPRLAEKLTEWSRWQSAIGVKILGLVTFSMEQRLPEGVPHLGLVENLESILTDQEVDQVIILESNDSMGWVTFITRLAEIRGCRILIYNQWEEFFDHPLIPVAQGPHTFFTFVDEPLENPVNRFCKRTLDLLVSIPVILFILPVVCLIALYFQKRQSPGPLFFRQRRGGQRGRPFVIYKIRTMHAEETEAPRQASRRDSRLYPFGEFMRRTSLDELPQFWNVLLGQMSVVGPRPHMLEHDARFSRIVEIYRNRHFVKPGVTGLAQIRGFRGEVTEPGLIVERVRYDLEYINTWSLWLDAGIIMRTAVQVLVPPKSAY